MTTPVRPLYLDYHATTPVDPRALAEMLPFFSERFGNPHSRQHAWGWEADKAVDAARRPVLPGGMPAVTAFALSGGVRHGRIFGIV